VGTEITFRFVRGDGYLRGVDVSLNRDHLVRLNRDEVGWYGTLVETPVWVDTLVVQGTIQTDLWSAFVGNQDGDPDLNKMRDKDRWEVVLMMDRVFQWQLDFYRQIHRGDSYRVAFEREVRPDESMRGMKILAAEIVNAGKPVSAVWFDLKGDGVGGYYDRCGESLRRAFLSKPLDFRRISSRFSGARFHPTLNVTRPHNGVDYAAASGTEVMATSDGIVTARGVSGGYGNLVEIRHANDYVTRYAHLSRFDSGIRVGGRVSQGQIIGYVGMTGLATGPHLHYELHLNGRPIDPMNMSVDVPQGEPIPADARDRWNADLQARYSLLERARGSDRGAEMRMAGVPSETTTGAPRAN
jgi:murein DD-endopeptidase MepM/ murein hydrolase activator NlpD